MQTTAFLVTVIYRMARDYFQLQHDCHYFQVLYHSAEFQWKLFFFTMHAYYTSPPLHMRNEGGQGGQNSPGAWSLWGRRITAGGAKCLLVAPKSPNNFTSTFFNTVNFLPKSLRLEHGGVKFASCPGRHLTSLRPWASVTFIPCVSFSVVGKRIFAMLWQSQLWDVPYTVNHNNSSSKLDICFKT